MNHKFSNIFKILIFGGVSGEDTYRCPVTDSPSTDGHSAFEASIDSAAESSVVMVDTDAVQELADKLDAVQIEDEVQGAPTVRQCMFSGTTALTMLVPITVSRHRIAAVVDTGSQVTVISSGLCNKLGLKGDGKMALRNAKAGSTMEGILQF